MRRTLDDASEVKIAKARPPEAVRAPTTAGGQPVNNVRWVERNSLSANDYNPNHVPPRELELLRISILADGWTQPIVARHTHRCGANEELGDVLVHDPGAEPDEIVDGFHRWTVSGDPEIAQLTDGLVPVVFIPQDTPLEHQMMSTIRHNRARGNHRVVSMADIVISLHEQHGLATEQIAELMQMEGEEIDRFLTRGSMIARADTSRGYSKGWTSRHS